MANIQMSERWKKETSKVHAKMGTSEVETCTVQGELRLCSLS